MATLQNFDAEIAKTKQVVEEMRSKIEQSGTVLETIAQTDKKIGAADFDIENARIEDVIKQQKVMEGNIADLIIGLEDATNVFGTEFENMKSFTGWETFVGIFSDESKQRMRTDRVRNMSLAGNLQELLVEVGHHRRHPQGAEAGARRPLQDLRGQPGAGHRAAQGDDGQPDRGAEADRGTEPAAARHREQDRRLDQPAGPHPARRRALQARHRIQREAGQGAGTAGRKPDAGALHLDVPDLRRFAQQPDRRAEHADQQADHRHRAAHRPLQGAGGFA